MNKQALTEALMAFENLKGKEVVLSGRYIIEDAARLVERLLPGECAQCEGAGIEAFIGASTVETGESVFYPCARCSGSGQVWDEGIVEAVAKAMHDHCAGLFKARLWLGVPENGRVEWRNQARAVLAAIAQLAGNPKNFRVGGGSQ